MNSGNYHFDVVSPSSSGYYGDVGLSDILGPHDHVAALVDAFLAVEKHLSGVPNWVVGNRDAERRISWPIIINGQTSSPTLELTAKPNDHSQFTISLCIPPCIWRLDFDPPSRGPHHNPLDRAKGLGGAAIYGPHFHAWSDNRHLATKMKLPDDPVCARQLPGNVRTFPNALRWFCGETKIRLESSQMIELPQRTELL